MTMMIKDLFFFTVAHVFLVYHFILSLFWKELDPMLEFFIVYGLSLASVVVGLRILVPRLVFMTIRVGISLANFLLKIAFQATLLVTRCLLDFAYGFFEDLAYLLWFLILLGTPLWLQQTVAWIVYNAGAVFFDTFLPGGGTARHGADIKILGDFSGWSKAAFYWNMIFRVPIRAQSSLNRLGRKVCQSEKHKVEEFLSKYSPRGLPTFYFRFAAIREGIQSKAIRSYQSILHAYRAIKTSLKETAAGVITNAAMLSSDIGSKMRMFFQSMGAALTQQQIYLYNFAKKRCIEVALSSVDEWVKHNFETPKISTLRINGKHNLSHRVHRLQEPVLWFLVTGVLVCVATLSAEIGITKFDNGTLAFLDLNSHQEFVAHACLYDSS
jgi:hypothetical protein